MVKQRYVARKRVSKDLDDILGIGTESDAETRKRGRGRPSFAEQDLDKEDTFINPATKRRLSDGVTAPYLASLFGMSPVTARSRLAACPIIPNSPPNRPYYRLPEAAAFLVTPKVDMEALLKQLDPSDFPRRLQEPFWNAKRKELAYYREAGEAWPTEAVSEVLSKLFLHIKDVTTLWVDSVEENSETTPEQRRIIRELVDGLMADLLRMVQEFAKSAQGASYLTAFKATEDAPEK